MELAKTFEFEASHILPNHPGKCSNLHGHTWLLTVYVTGKIDVKTGMVIDYGEISRIVKPVIEELDHAHLGAWTTNKGAIITDRVDSLKRVPWLITDNPTSENLVVEIGAQLVRKGLQWSALSLDETRATCCTITREEFDALSFI